MAKILSIDTATEKALVCIADEENILSFCENQEQKTHASFVQPAIERLLYETNMKLSQLDAIAVSNGPGSYTGLRVGLSSAKGIAYAIKKPLILLNTLEVMAQNAIIEEENPKILYAPMIDARRMEVFTAIYNISLNNIFVPSSVVLEKETFEDILKINKVLFFGSGSNKWRELTTEKENTLFTTISNSAKGLNILAQKNFDNKNFSDLTYSEPFYLKSFYTKSKSKTF